MSWIYRLKSEVATDEFQSAAPATIDLLAFKFKLLAKTTSVIHDAGRLLTLQVCSRKRFYYSRRVEVHVNCLSRMSMVSNVED